MTDARSDSQDKIVSRMIEAAGHTTQSMGVGRVLGQIYAYLYFSRTPQSLNDLTRALGISKGSASMGVRQLEQWGALTKIWVKGDRKDYYQARETMGRIMRSAVADLAGKRLATFAALLGEAGQEVEEVGRAGGKVSDEDAFIRERIGRLKDFQSKAEGMWNGVVLKMLMK